MTKRIVQFVSFIGLELFRWLFRGLPHHASLRLGKAMGLVAYLMLGQRRTIARENLRRAFPSLAPAEIESVARQVFANFGKTAAEFLRAPRLSAQEVSRLVELQGREHLDRALGDGKGALLITAHFGNWELMARHLADLGYKLSVVARDANDPRTTDIVNEIRRSNGYAVFSRGNAARFILGCLRRNEFVGILPDQNAGDVFVRFFDRECGSVVGPAVMHLRTKAPLIPVFCVRLPDNRHRVEVRPPLTTQTTGDAEADARTIMQQIHSAIEDQVRGYPEQWLWFHDRWKSARLREEELAVGA